MDVFSSAATAFASQHLVLAYLIAYGATIFLGNIGAFISLWLAFQGALGAWGIPGVLIVAFAANVTGDMLWYSLGRGLRSTRVGAWIKRRFPNHGRFDDHIVERGPRWMLFAKFAYGTNFPILFSLGWAQFPFRRFIRRSLLAIAIWLPVILGVSFGLYSSLSPLAAVLTLRRLEIIFLVALVAFVVLQWAVGRVIEKLFRRNLTK
jgi:membrane protein DedA with SNARE-associated domain